MYERLRTYRCTVVAGEARPGSEPEVDHDGQATIRALGWFDLRERQLSGEPVDDHGAAVAWCWANPEAALPRGESNHAVRRRGVAVVNELARRHRGEMIVVGSHGNLLALILQHWFLSVDHAFWSRLTMPDIYTFTLRDEGPPELARPWDAGSRFLPVSEEGKDA